MHTLTMSGLSPRSRPPQAPSPSLFGVQGPLLPHSHSRPVRGKSVVFGAGCAAGTWPGAFATVPCRSDLVRIVPSCKLQPSLSEMPNHTVSKSTLVPKITKITQNACSDQLRPVVKGWTDSAIKGGEQSTPRHACWLYRRRGYLNAFHLWRPRQLELITVTRAPNLRLESVQGKVQGRSLRGTKVHQKPPSL